MTTGRHRKQVDRALPIKRASTVLAVTAIAATPAALLNTAHAADTDVWDRIAECESSGDWSINTGNGYSGGLQFTPSTWESFGGTQYAKTAADASRSEQISVATRVQEAQGWGAWPVCSKKAGATGAPPAVDPTPADSPTDATEPTPSPPADSASGSDSSTYTVKSGDTLSEIARTYASGRSALDLAEASGIADPDVIMPGQKVNVASQSVPAPSTSSSEKTQTSSTQTTSSTGSHRATNDAIGLARTWIGTDYSWGGNSKSGVDCSGLVQQVFADLGVDLPRTAAAQANAVERISRSEARPGDLVFGTTGGKVTHVGIYMGDGKQIDAPTEGKTVGVHSLYRNQNIFGRVV